MHRKATGNLEGAQQDGQRPPERTAAAASGKGVAAGRAPQPQGAPDQAPDFQFARLQFEDGRCASFLAAEVCPAHTLVARGGSLVDARCAGERGPRRLGSGKAGGKKKPSKEQLLAAAEAKQAERQAAAASLDGQVQLVHEGWRTALARASGEKVLDDPKLLKKSLKKEVRLEQHLLRWPGCDGSPAHALTHTLMCALVECAGQTQGEEQQGLAGAQGRAAGAKGQEAAEVSGVARVPGMACTAISIARRKVSCPVNAGADLVLLRRRTENLQARVDQKIAKKKEKREKKLLGAGFEGRRTAFLGSGGGGGGAGAAAAKKA